MARRGRSVARDRGGATVPIPQRVLPPVDQAVVAAHGTLPDDGSRGVVQFGDDVAQAASASGAPPAGDVGVPITVRQVVGDLGDDRPEEERTTQLVGFTMWSLWNEGDQAESMSLLL